MTKANIENLEVQFEIIKSKLELAQQLVTNEGFYQYWFNQLAVRENKTKSRKEVFENVNKLYKTIFKTSSGRYVSYDSFRSCTRKYKKSNMHKFL